jgi:hypothetical protein
MMIWTSWSKACRRRSRGLQRECLSMFHEIYSQVSREKWEIAVQQRAHLEVRDDGL